MLRLTITAGCFVIQSITSVALLSEPFSTPAVVGGVTIGLLTAVPTALRFADRFFTGRDCFAID